MINRLTPADPDDRKALFAAYAAAESRAADLGTTVYDDSIIQAAYKAVRPLLLAEGARAERARVADYLQRAAELKARPGGGLSDPLTAMAWSEAAGWCLDDTIWTEPDTTYCQIRHGVQHQASRQCGPACLADEETR